MRIAVTSDLHLINGNKEVLSALKESLQKLKDKSPDVFINCGDYGLSTREDFVKCLELIRKYYDGPMYSTMGNHDFWDKEFRKECRGRCGWDNLKEYYMSVFKTFNVHWLSESGPIKYNGYKFSGFDGWYESFNPPSNDENYMPYRIEGIPLHSFMIKRMKEQLANILKDKKTLMKEICVTHFDIKHRSHPDMAADPRVFEVLSERFDFVFFGHSHIEQNYKIKDCIYVNSGSHYGKPKISFVDINV
jgi:predicted phosphodiesterase